MLSLAPERLYSLRNLYLEQLEVGDVVPVVISGYDCRNKLVHCVISPQVRNGFIKGENFTFPAIDSKFDENNIPKAIKSYVGKQVLARVVRKCQDDGDSVELDRSMVLKETIEYFSSNLGTIVEVATIENILPYGAFVDIGNGVRSLLHITEFSNARYSDLHDFFKVGDAIKVKILDFNSEKCWFYISRRQAYERIPMERGSNQVVRICDPLEDGSYVEYNPATIGIMDTLFPAKSGKYAICYVKADKDKGFTANFTSYLDTPTGLSPLQTENPN